MKWDRTAFVDRMVSRFGRERWNEHVKMFASSMGSVGVACFIGGFVAPLVNAVRPTGMAIPVLFVAGTFLQLSMTRTDVRIW